tara:strand:- start:256 stop:627 length:372 start_codon:yes stop_codon:yes gene_type:complete
MARIDTISLSGNNFKDVTTGSITGLLICNTDTEDITFDLIIGPKTLHNGTSSTNGVFILKDIPVPVGSTFVWDDDDILTDAFKGGSVINNYQDKRNIFTPLENNTFLIRVGSGHTADVLLKRR